jgi:membrane peptidoglycan carboxypeptidase
LKKGVFQGGSTITQQVIKNSLLTSDKKISRKLKEWVLSIRLEKIITKDEILTIYLNESPYGGSIYGIEEASKTFFGKNASGVTLAEAAYLAAIPNAPTYFSPYGKNKDKLDQRKNFVLQKMLDNGFIKEKADYSRDTDDDGFNAVQGGRKNIQDNFYCYIHDFSSGQNYEIATADDNDNESFKMNMKPTRKIKNLLIKSKLMKNAFLKRIKNY